MDSQLQYDIESFSQVCLEDFEEFIGALKTLPSGKEAKLSTRSVKNDFGRFKIWCGNLGALQKGRSSLDVRLRDSAVMREAVVAFLHNMHGCLQQCIDLAAGRRHQTIQYLGHDVEDFSGDVENDQVQVSDEESSDSSDTSDDDLSELEIVYEEAREALDGLNRLSFKIRNASHRSLSSRALSFRMLDRESGQDLFLSYAIHDQRHVREFFQQIQQPQQSQQLVNEGHRQLSDSTDSFLIERLGKAITSRRRCFAYWQRHSLKLSRPEHQQHLPTVVSKGPNANEISRTEASEGKSGIRSHAQGDYTLGLAHSQGPGPIMSATDFSRNLGNLDDNLDTETVISFATTAKDVDGKSADIPPPPLSVYSKPEFVCPYCSVLCPSRQGKGKFWRTHVLQDVQPYVCTITDCVDGDILYSSRGDWIEHERLCHRRVWRCYDRQHRTRLYRQEDELRCHLVAEHSDKTEEQVRDLISLTETTVEDVRDTCPFCASQGPFPQGLYNHMAYHQEKLALFSLPLNLNWDHDDEAASGNALGIRSEGSLGESSLHFSDVSKSRESNKNVSDVEDDRRGENSVQAVLPTTQLFRISDFRTIAENDSLDRALREASLEGDQQAVQTLLENGASANAISEIHGSALQAASSRGHGRIVALLLRYGADVNALGGLHGSALQAASVGHRQVAKILLDHGADVNAQGGKAGNALAAAASLGHSEIVELLLDRDADVHASCADYGTALGAACYGGSVTVVELLLSHGADIDQPIETYGTALGAAIFENQPAVVEALLSRGADVHKEGGHFNNPLGVAAYKGNRHIVDRLLALGADIHAMGELFPNALSAAASGGQVDIVELLLEKGTDVNLVGGIYGSALASAATNGEHEVIKLLLGKGANVAIKNEAGLTSVHFASANGHVRAIQVLLDHGADLGARSQTGWTPLTWASYKGHSRVIELLLNHGAEINDADNGGWTALLHASDRGHLEVVQILLHKKADWSLVDDKGWSPLNAASSGGHLETARLLLDKGAYSSADKSGNTPLHSAARAGHRAVVKLLLDRGAKSTLNGVGSAPLQMAAAAGHLEIVGELLEQKVDLFHADDSGCTALIMAASNGHATVVQLLLASGANPSNRDRIGYTPMNAAATNGHVATVKVLMSWGGDSTTPAASGMTPLVSATTNGHIAVGRLLLENGAFEAANGLDPTYGTIVNFLALHAFAELLQFVIEQKDADVRQSDTHKRTALHMAARSGDLEIFQYVSGKNLDYAAIDVKGDNLVSFAASGGSLAMLSIVLDRRPDLAATRGFWSPLHWACKAGKANIVDFLIAKGWKSESITVTELHGDWTPLAVALFHGNMDMISEISERSRKELGATGDEHGHKGEDQGSTICNGCFHVGLLCN